MIGVTALPVRENHDARTQAAKHSRDLEPVLIGVLNVAVGQIKRLAVGDVEDASCGSGLGCAVGGGAASAGFALSEVEDTGAPATGVHGEQRAAASLLDIVAMRSDGENIDGLHVGYASRGGKGVRPMCQN